MKRNNLLNTVLAARNKVMVNPIPMVAVSECKYCDGTMSHRPYGMDDVPVCVSCGAEWTPITVHYTKAELHAPECYICGEYTSVGDLCIQCERDMNR